MSDQNTTTETDEPTKAQQIAQFPDNSYKDAAERDLRQSLSTYTSRVAVAKATVTDAERDLVSHTKWLKWGEERLLEYLTSNAEKEKRAAAARARRDERAKADLLVTLSNLSPELIAEELIKKGVRRLGQPTMSPRGILQEALMHIESTFWVKNAEVNHNGVYGDESMIPESLSKYVAIKVNGGVQVVTGMCSIGALALARVALKDEDATGEKFESIPSYGHLQARDTPTRIAGAALARAIAETDEEYGYRGWATESAGSLIAKWNDNQARTREEIVEAFENAMASPLLDVEEVWSLSFPRYGGEGYFRPRLVSLTQEEAVAEAEAINAGGELSDLMTQVLKYSDISPEKQREFGSVKPILVFPQPTVEDDFDDEDDD